MKNKFKAILFGSLLTAFLVVPTLIIGSSSVSSAPVSAEDNPTNNLSLLSMIKAYHDNNLQTVTTNPYVDFTLKHGWLNAGGTPGCTDYTTKDSGDNYIGPDADNEAKIDWGGARLIRGSDCTIVKFTAKKDIIFSFFATNMTNTGDYNNKNTISIYRVHPTANYDYYENTWIGNGNIVFTVNPDDATKLEDFSFSITLQAGDKVYWEFGAWEDLSGNLDINARGFGFKVKQYEYAYISDMVVDVSKSLSTPISKNLIDFTIGHGDISNVNSMTFNAFTDSNPGSSIGDTNGNCYAENWRLFSGYNDGLIVKIIAKKYIKLDIARTLPGNGWSTGATLSVVKNKTLVKTVDIPTDQGNDPAGPLYLVNVELNTEDVLYWQFKFQWEDTRNIAMASDGDIRTTMPFFLATEVGEKEYLAKDFATDFLKLTDEVCAGYDGTTNNKDALNTKWGVLSDASHYQALPLLQKEKLASSQGSTSGSDVEKAIARYDYLVGKYQLTDFLSRTPVSESKYVANSLKNESVIIISIIAAISVCAFGGMLIIKKRKEDK